MSNDIKTFPENVPVLENQKTSASAIYGNRFHADQTLYEYLIEFLLIFVSGDDDDSNPKEKMHFHLPNASGVLSYTVEPRMGLKRFIFFDKNKKNDAPEIDKRAYKELIEALKNKIEDGSDEDKIALIESIQDLFHGYAVVLKKRAWCAQALLPICPELIFCEAMPKNKVRAEMKWDDVRNDDAKCMDIDKKFDFDKRNFLARGGELYYLHILQGLQGQPEKQKRLEWLLTEQLAVQGRKISEIANFVQKTWEDYMGYQESPVQRLHLSFIPETAYKNIAADSVDELINYMSCNMHPIKKIELLSKGIMIQVIRMLSVATTNYLGVDRECTIVDMSGNNGFIIKKIAANNFTVFQDQFTNAIGQNTSDKLKSRERLQAITTAKKNTLDIVRSKGKELQCIIPSSGPYERFSLPEDCIRFLVLSLIAPGQKMTLDMFLELMFEKYRIVVGPAQYKKMKSSINVDKSLANSFSKNVQAFQDFLQSTGFLRELSDATSIVVNPYEEVEEGNF